MSTSCRAAVPPGAASAKPRRRRSWRRSRTRSSPSPANASAACRSWITTCRRARPDATSDEGERPASPRASGSPEPSRRLPWLPLFARDDDGGGFHVSASPPGFRRIKRLAIALFVLGAAALAHAQGAAAAESKGEYLARAGDCVACHSVPGGKAFAGGLKMGTPLGAIYSTNITPDPDNGIGNYTFEDFDRAVRKGVAKDGDRLYPAMTYPSYAKITDDDMHALYRFFIKQVPPVHQANLKSEIPALLSFRWPVAFWNFVFAPSASYVPKSDHDAVWNRGAYLVQGPSHCGA